MEPQVDRVTVVTLRRPDVLEAMANRLENAHRRALDAVAEVVEAKMLFRRLSSEANEIAEQVWAK